MERTGNLPASRQRSRAGRKAAEARPGTLRARLQRGVTLVEATLVIGILSLIILAALMMQETVVNQRRMTQAIADVGAIRSAVSLSGLSTPNWNQIAALLPGRLELIASESANRTLPKANPWGESYVLGFESGSTNWTLNIAGVPDGLTGVLAKQLDLNGGDAVGIGPAEDSASSEAGSLANCRPDGMRLTVPDSKRSAVMTVCVSYENRSVQ